MIKAKLYTGQRLVGEWRITRKLDGVRAIKSPDGYVSRAGKPLHNLQNIEGNDLEIFNESWEKTISLVRTQDSTPVPKEYAYSLHPLDERLDLGTITNPTHEQIQSLLQDALTRGDEGLVIRKRDEWLKVKPLETYDVPITGILPGKGKHLGRIGALITPMGNVGTGLTDKQRAMVQDFSIGTIIEVECMQLTPQGKFRHPRFKRIRFDKSQE